MTDKNTEITFGALAPPLHEQLGWTKEETEHLQKLHDSIVYLKVKSNVP